MTDYSHLVTSDFRTLDGAANRGTPYSTLEISLNEDGDVSLGIRTYYGGDGTPSEIWHGRTRVYILASAKGTGGRHVDLDKLRADLAEGGWLSQAIDTIAAGHSVEHDGRNLVGQMTPEARDAEEEMVRRLDNNPDAYIDDTWSTWHVGDWLQSCHHEITADMTDEQLEAWADDQEATAVRDRVDLIGDVADWAREVRDEKRADAQDSAED